MGYALMKDELDEASAKKLRKHVRIEPENGRPIRVDINGNGFIDVVNATDISQNGIGITVPHKFANCRTDSEVNLLIALPEPISSSIKVNGTIRHVDSNQFGIMFIDLTTEDRDKIKAYVQSRLHRKTTGFFGKILDWFDDDD
ncbi:MAG: PilZ domain-containing protein [Gammaproteobacteria bacterium]|nr:MAG: PilZ domain-containing protein [Gammaproteobacteria bacterium]